jgi:hypothetical protein
MKHAVRFTFTPFHSRLPLNQCAKLRSRLSLRSASSAPFRFFRSILRSTALQAGQLALACRFAQLGDRQRTATAPLETVRGSVAWLFRRFAQTIRQSALRNHALNHTAISDLLLYPLRRSHHPALYLASLAGWFVGRAAPSFETKGNAWQFKARRPGDKTWAVNRTFNNSSVLLRKYTNTTIFIIFCQVLCAPAQARTVITCPTCEVGAFPITLQGRTKSLYQIY